MSGSVSSSRRDPIDIVIEALGTAREWARYTGTDQHLSDLIMLAQGEALRLKDIADRSATAARREVES